MKLNSFQKLSLIVYIITLISIMFFVVPFKSINEDGIISINYDFLLSDRNSIDFFRYSIFIIVISIIFILLIKFYQGYNDIENKIYNKKIKIEKRVFVIYITSLSIIFLITLSSNFINTKKINEINYLKEKNEKKLSDYNLKKMLRMSFYNKMDSNFNLTITKGSVPKLWEVMNNMIKNNYKESISTLIKYNIFKDEKELKKFITENNYNKLDKETEKKYDDILSDIENKKNEINNINKKLYSSNDTIRTLVLTNLILILSLFILRPTFIFFGTIFSEKKY